MQFFQNTQVHLRKKPESSQKCLFYADNLSVKYGKIHALNSIQLSINQSEIVFITGASGAGKSTLINVLAGDVAPTHGRLVTPESDFIARIHQETRLINRQTGEDNLWLAYDPQIYQSKDVFYRDMEELSRAIGARDYLHLKMNACNGGLRQKVAFLRALLTKPQILLADEPTSSLDTNSSLQMFEVINFYQQKRGLTVVWSSHNREFIKKLPGRVLHLENGKLVYSGHACFI